MTGKSRSTRRKPRPIAILSTADHDEYLTYIPMAISFKVEEKPNDRSWRHFQDMTKIQTTFCLGKTEAWF
jgi:hypothetical protein